MAMATAMAMAMAMAMPHVPRGCRGLRLRHVPRSVARWACGRELRSDPGGRTDITSCGPKSTR